MDSKVLEHIFDKFYQGDPAHKSEGNGLGLALVRRILDLCGGEISVESEKGAGSSFQVCLQTEDGTAKTAPPPPGGGRSIRGRSDPEEQEDSFPERCFEPDVSDSGPETKAHRYGPEGSDSRPLHY